MSLNSRRGSNKEEEDSTSASRMRAFRVYQFELRPWVQVSGSFRVEHSKRFGSSIPSLVLGFRFRVERTDPKPCFGAPAAAPSGFGLFAACSRGGSFNESCCRNALQGCLAHKKTPSHLEGPRYSPTAGSGGDGHFLMSEVPLYCYSQRDLLNHLLNRMTPWTRPTRVLFEEGGG